MSSGPAAQGSRRWTALLLAMALVLPIGALLQPWVWPARSHLPVVDPQLHTPIVLITIGGLRADRVHHLGYARPTTPSLDRVAEDGVSFPMFYSNGNASLATLAALFTADCPTRNGVRGAQDNLPQTAFTLAERLREIGYLNLSFCADPGLMQHGLQQGFARYRLLPHAGARQVLDAALAALREADNPNVFLWIDLADLLPPYGGPALDNRRFAPDAPPGFGSSAADYDLDAAQLAERGWGAREPGWLAARYDAALADMDEQIGRFLDALAADGRLESMTVCIAGTRGERLDDRGGRAFAHGCDLLDSSIHVPLLLRLPSETYRGLQPRRLAQAADIGPTLVDVGAHNIWEGVPGRSLVPILLSQQRVNKAVFADGLVQEQAGGESFYGHAQIAETFKVVTDESGQVRAAYMTNDDPGERNPVPINAETLGILREQGGEWAAGCLPR